MTDNVSEYIQRLQKKDRGSGRVIKVSEDLQGNPLPHTIKFNSVLLEEISYLPEWNQNDWDTFGIIVGKPGVGKTILAEKIGLILNASFCLKDILFTSKQYDEWAASIKEPYQVSLFDEADELGEHHASNSVRSMVRNSKRIRTKNAYSLLATPTLRDINQHFIYRARFIIYVPMYGPKDRGYFCYYAGEDNLWDLYTALKLDGEKQSVYMRHARVIRNGYHGRDDMSEWFIDKESYEDKKELARASFEEDSKGVNEVNWERNKLQLVNWFRVLTNLNGEEPTQAILAEHLGVSQGTVSKWIKKLDDEGGWQ